MATNCLYGTIAKWYHMPIWYHCENECLLILFLLHVLRFFLVLNGHWLYFVVFLYFGESLHQTVFRSICACFSLHLVNHLLLTGCFYLHFDRFLDLYYFHVLWSLFYFLWALMWHNYFGVLFFFVFFNQYHLI